MTHTLTGAEHIYGISSFGLLTGGHVDELPLENNTII